MMKIRIIELLNKIANGEEMPKEIKFDNEVFVYIGKWEQYVTKEEEIPLLRRICDYNYSGLNDEIEILEDNTEEQEKLGESWKEVGKRVGEWAKEFEQGFKESFTEIINYPFKNLEDNTEEIEELPTKLVYGSAINGNPEYHVTQKEIVDKINELVKAVKEIRKEKE